MNENNIQHFIEYNDIMNSKSIICDVCGRFNITKGECPKKEFLSLGYKNVNNKCYCSDCYKQYVMITNDDVKINKRPTKHQYYLNIAKVVASRSTCLRKKYGAILVKNDIISFLVVSIIFLKNLSVNTCVFVNFVLNFY